MPDRIELTPSQRTRCNRLIRRLCANYDNGNCLPLDEGNGCVCVQMISLSLICKYFRTADAIYAILSEEKPNQKEQIKLPRDELRKYFPQNYSDEQIKRDILKGLELLKRQRERNRDAR